MQNVGRKAYDWFAFFGLTPKKSVFVLYAKRQRWNILCWTYSIRPDLFTSFLIDRDRTICEIFAYTAYTHVLGKMLKRTKRFTIRF